jgi:uncharacterized coiled-coil protein SlyX
MPDYKEYSDEEIRCETIVRFLTRNPHPNQMGFFMRERGAFVDGAKWMRDYLLPKLKERDARIVELEREAGISADMFATMCSHVSELESEVERLKGVLRHLVHLHICEQEGIGSGQPTPQQWMDAVDKASELILEPPPTDPQEDMKHSAQFPATTYDPPDTTMSPSEIESVKSLVSRLKEAEERNAKLMEVAEELAKVLKDADEHLSHYYPHDDPTIQMSIFTLQPALAKFEEFKKK